MKICHFDKPKYNSKYLSTASPTSETTSVGSSGESLTLDSFNAVKALLTNMQAIEFSFFSGAKASLQTYVDQLNVQIEAESKKILIKFRIGISY